MWPDNQERSVLEERNLWLPTLDSSCPWVASQWDTETQRKYWALSLPPIARFKKRVLIYTLLSVIKLPLATQATVLDDEWHCGGSSQGTRMEPESTLKWALEIGDLVGSCHSGPQWPGRHQVRGQLPRAGWGYQKSSQQPRGAKGPSCLTRLARARSYPIKVTR